MLIKSQPLNFQKEEQGKLYFKDQEGQEVIIASALLLDYKDRSKELYLSLDTELLEMKQSKDILNDILKGNKQD